MFSSRREAGQLLAAELNKSRVRADIVLGIPRGGVVVAAEIAREMKLPLDVLVVKKLGAPDNPELAIGALAPDGVTYLDNDLVRSTLANKTFLNREIQVKHHELVERERVLQAKRPAQTVKGRVVVLADDGVATGATLFAAIAWLKKQLVQKIILAIPVAAPEIVSKLRQQVDDYVILEEPVSLRAVGEYYKDFSEVSEDEVVQLLASSELASSV